MNKIVGIVLSGAAAVNCLWSMDAIAEMKIPKACERHYQDWQKEADQEWHYPEWQRGGEGFSAHVKHDVLISCLCKQGNDRACQAGKKEPGQAYRKHMEQLEQDYKKNQGLKKVKGNVKDHQ